jgi:hypothetical protein
VTPDQAKQFYKDGYLILPEAVKREHALTARRLIFERLGTLRTAARESLMLKHDTKSLFEATLDVFRTGEEAIFIDLFNESSIKLCLEAALESPVIPVRGAQLATTFPIRADEVTNETGYLNKDTPHHAWAGHLDGLWNGATPPPRAGTNIRGRHLSAWQAEPSTNGMHRTFPEFNTNIANFSALVGIALSDQTVLGCGNLGLLKGGHRHMERFFKKQSAAGGPLGPDGPDWPREDREAPNRHGLRHYPDEVRKKYRRGAITTSDGKIWPKPTLVRLGLGDAVIVHFSTPHGATAVTTSDPRFMLYFRCTSSARPGANLRHYPEALCDVLLEWQGVKAVVNPA